ncbi:MAG TPA: hypothetical protein PKY77_18940 [Phycisphaerae bacterium]|nr:hypothetical protein [Phycisphaerae bacterium]HRY68461.1 hypothetical protein [Phycisphaerae bacterium]HSA28503.1 hypothetical protein [Phycisphaerae bacterium]
MRSRIAQLAVVIVLSLPGVGLPAEPKAASTPAQSEEDRLRQDMRRWNLDRLISGSPSLETYTPAELAAYAELQARSHANRLKKEYQLTPDQEKVVRKRLDELKQEYPAYWKKNQAELSKLSGQIKQMSRNRSAPAVAEQIRELSRRRTRLMTGHPLYASVVNEEIESLLPEQQVANAQERQEKNTAERRSLLTAAIANRTLSLRPSTTRPAPIVQLRSRTSSPFSSWRAYVNLFIDAYDLNDDQQAKAESVLEEFEERRDDYQETHEKDFMALRNTKDLEARFRKGEELRAPIAKMYEEMVSRLEAIPTPAQRKGADEAVQAAKAAAATRPSASRPTPLSRLRLAASRPSADRQGEPASP